MRLFPESVQFNKILELAKEGKKTEQYREI